MNERLSYLYLRYINETCTPEELQELQSLIKNTANHEDLTRLLDSTWDELGASNLSDVSKDKRNTIYHDILTTYPKKRNPYTWLYGVAAMLLFVIAVSGVYMHYLDNGQSDIVRNSQPLVNDAAPGGNKAHLTLADGSVVHVDQIQDGQVRNDQGTKIVKQNGQLFFSRLQENTLDTGYNQITIPNGGQYQVILPDGTHVWLNAASSLRFPVVFNKTERTVELTGEAYFEVAENKKQPFRVNINQTTSIEVLGTHFNVMAYANEHSVNTTLLSGSIRIRNGKHSTLVLPGQQARSDEAGIQLYTADLDEAVAWKNGLFQFNSTNLQTIMHQIERWYNVKVHYTTDLSGKRLTGLISRNTHLSDVLKMLELAGSVHFQIDGTKIMVSP